MMQRLSSKGRQEFGTWLANRLVIACGGAIALVLVPALAGRMALPSSMIALGWTIVFGAAGLAALIKFLTVERVGESLSVEEVPDV